MTVRVVSVSRLHECKSVWKNLYNRQHQLPILHSRLLQFWGFLYPRNVDHGKSDAQNVTKGSLYKLSFNMRAGQTSHRGTASHEKR